MRVGTYSVRVELQGFKRFTSTGNAVRIGEPATVNAVLSAASAAFLVLFAAATSLIVVSDAYDALDRLRSFDLIAEAAELPRTID